MARSRQLRQLGAITITPRKRMSPANSGQFIVAQCAEAKIEAALAHPIASDEKAPIAPALPTAGYMIAAFSGFSWSWTTMVIWWQAIIEAVPEPSRI